MQNQPTIIPKITQLDATQHHKFTDVEDELIFSRDFFPMIQLMDVRNAMRIDGTITKERLKHAIIEAISTVNRDLQIYRKTYEEKGYSTLADCDDEMISNENVLEYKYKRAVYSLAVANLYERYRSFDSTKDGQDKAEELLHTSNDLRRDYHFAVRDILNTQGMISELI